MILDVEAGMQGAWPGPFEQQQRGTVDFQLFSLKL